MSTASQRKAAAISFDRHSQYAKFQENLDELIGHDIHFDKGLVAFERFQNFSYSRDTKVRPFLYMKSRPEGEVAFICVEPFLLDPSYKVRISAETASQIGLESPSDALILCLVTVGKDMYSTTANLLSPLVISMRSRRGAQVILDDLGPESLRFNVWEALVRQP
ncbi:MAG: hypothetical protein RL095_1639 [Verrucomicrobiota bacterium]|jgi:flagellar assembly factor FliW